MVKLYMTYIQEIDRLYNLDFSSPFSAPVRVLGVAIGSILVCSYLDEYWPMLWPIGYATIHFLYFFYLHLGLKSKSAVSLRVAYGLHLAVITSFVWLPVYLMTIGDHTATMVGAALFASLLVLLVRRSDPSVGHVICQAAILSVSLVILAISTIRVTTDPAGIAGVILSVLVLQFYFIQAWRYTRRVTREFRDSTLRAAQTEKMASIGRLAGGVAHDFNNQLTAISGNLALMTLCNNDDERDEILQSAMIATEQAISTVKQLTSFARMEQSKLFVIETSDVMGDLEKIANRLVPATITCSFRDDATQTFLAVKGQVLNGLLNLISNSIDAMPKGGSIIVECSDLKSQEAIPIQRGVKLPPGSYVEFRVEDTGCGIDDTIIDHIFDDYFTTKPIGEGTGLGLASISGIIISFGGGVSVESSPKGTKVRLLIPALEEAA